MPHPRRDQHGATRPHRDPLAVQREIARKDVENLALSVVGPGPQSTIQRGFAIARDEENAPLTSWEEAIAQASFVCSSETAL